MGRSTVKRASARTRETYKARLVGDLRRTRLCCSGSERRRICTPKWGHSAFSFWFWVVGDHPSALISQSRQSKQSWHSSVSHVSQSSRGTWSSRCMQRRRHTLRTSDTPTHHAQWEARARSAIAPTANTSPHRWGEAESHTHRSSTDTLHVSARSMWPALSPRSYLAFSTAACGHAPRRAGLGGRPRSRTRCGHARWLRWLRA